MLPAQVAVNREKAGVFPTLSVSGEADDLVMVRDPKLPGYFAAFAAAGHRLLLKTVGVAVERYCNGGFEAFVPDLPRTADGKSTLEQRGK